MQDSGQSTTVDKENRPRGYGYKPLPNGRTAICFKGKVNGKSIDVRLELPEGVKELTPVQGT
jgi:hypothetical protein